MWYANSVKTGTDRKTKRVKPKKRSPSPRSVQKYVWPDGNPVQPIVTCFDIRNTSKMCYASYQQENRSSQIDRYSKSVIPWMGNIPSTSCSVQGICQIGYLPHPHRSTGCILRRPHSAGFIPSRSYFDPAVFERSYFERVLSWSGRILIEIWKFRSDFDFYRSSASCSGLGSVGSAGNPV